MDLKNGVIHSCDLGSIGFCLSMTLVGLHRDDEAGGQRNQSKMTGKSHVFSRSVGVVKETKVFFEERAL